MRMVPSIILRPRSVLAVLSLIGPFQPQQVEAARAYCQTSNFKAGDIISTSSEGRTYCGHRVGRYLAIRNNELFHLQCQANAANPAEAKVVVLNLGNEATRSQTFGSQQLCDTQPSGSGGLATGENAYNIAMKLSQAFVPYDTLTCNAQHYIEYLANGKTLNVPKPTCPVFKRFSQNTKTRGASFRLEGQGGMAYNWPSSGMRLTLVTPASTPTRKAVSVWEPYENANVSRASSLHTTNRKGGGAGGGHGSSGGHSGGSSAAGRGGGGGEGSTGSSETGGGGSSASTTIIAGAAANGGGNNKKRKGDTSAAGRIKPWFSLSKVW